MNDVSYKKERICRIKIDYRNGTFSTGTGFFISRSGELLTCAHVILGKALTELRQDTTFIATQGLDEEEKITNFQRNETSSIQVTLPNGTVRNANLKKIDADYDIALLQLSGSNIRIKYFDYDFSDPSKLDYDDNIFFCGYQYAVDYQPTNFPFTVNSGIISTFTVTIVAGAQHEHLQINSINLGGNSGAPLFRKSSNIAIGIINGNMNWGSDNVLQSNNGIVSPSVFRIPLSIAYATSLNLINAKTDIFS